MSLVDTDHTPAATARRTVALLYADLAPNVRRIVASNVAAPSGVVEDACQVAWGRLLTHHAEIQDGAELGWLVTTATRVMLRTLHAHRREVSYEIEAEAGELWQRTDPRQRADLRSQLSDRLGELRVLTPRQRQLLCLRGIGYGYAEIAARTGDSERTVQRQLMRGRRRLRQAA
jgi:RNA polymerase sigma factor (sigma-70 family)